MEFRNKKRLIEKVRTISFTHISAFSTWHSAEQREIPLTHKFSFGGKEEQAYLQTLTPGLPTCESQHEAPQCTSQTRPGWGRGDCFFKCVDTNTRLQENQENMTPPKEQNRVLETDPKEMEIYKLPDKEFEIIILEHLSGSVS